MLVDGGGRYDDSFDTGARVVEPVLRARGMDASTWSCFPIRIPTISTACCVCWQRFEVGTLWTSGDDGHNPKTANYWLWRISVEWRRRCRPGSRARACGSSRSDRGWVTWWVRRRDWTRTRLAGGAHELCDMRAVHRRHRP